MGDCREGEEGLKLYESAAEYFEVCTKRKGSADMANCFLAADCYEKAAVSFTKASSRCEQRGGAERAEEYKEKVKRCRDMAFCEDDIGSTMNTHERLKFK